MRIVHGAHKVTSSAWHAHSIAVLQVLRKVVLQVRRLLLHALHHAGVGLLMWRL